MIVLFWRENERLSLPDIMAPQFLALAAVACGAGISNRVRRNDSDAALCRCEATYKHWSASSGADVACRRVERLALLESASLPLLHRSLDWTEGSKVLPYFRRVSAERQVRANSNTSAGRQDTHYSERS